MRETGKRTRTLGLTGQCSPSAGVASLSVGHELEERRREADRGDGVVELDGMRQLQQHYVTGAAGRSRRRRIVVFPVEDDFADRNANRERVRLRMTM